MKPLLLIFIIAIAFSKNAISQKNTTNAVQTTYYEYDALSNTVSLSDNSANIIENYKHSAFGEPVITDANHNILAASAFGNRFVFTGREFIQQLNLYDYRNRFYSAALGRFMQIDPLRFDADDYNLYRYVINNIPNATDPFGNAPIYASVYPDNYKTNQDFIEIGWGGRWKQLNNPNYYPIGWSLWINNPNRCPTSGSSSGFTNGGMSGFAAGLAKLDALGLSYLVCKVFKCVSTPTSLSGYRNYQQTPWLTRPATGLPANTAF